MGAGLAKQFKNMFPALNRHYVSLCKKKELEIGVPELVRSTFGSDFVLFPTKQHWKNPSRIQWVDWGLEVLAEMIADKEIESIAIPPLGCGLGGLKWDTVKELIEEHLGDFNTVIEVYEPRS